LAQGIDIGREEIRIEVKRSAELQSVIPILVRLRTEVFRDWAYLYEADPALEQRYLASLCQEPARGGGGGLRQRGDCWRIHLPPARRCK